MAEASKRWGPTPAAVKSAAVGNNRGQGKVRYHGSLPDDKRSGGRAMPESGNECSDATTRCPMGSDDSEDTSGRIRASAGKAANRPDAPQTEEWCRDDFESSSGELGPHAAQDARRSSTARTRNDSSNSQQDAGDGDVSPHHGKPSPSLQRDGPIANAGSVGHPHECKACAFYCFSLRGCRNGDACTYCHMYHESKLRQRREEWKKSQRDKCDQNKRWEEVRTSTGCPASTGGQPPSSYGAAVGAGESQNRTTRHRMMWCPTGSSWVAGPDANRGRITEAGGERVDRGAFQKKASSAATRQSADHADKGAGGVAVSTSASGAGVRNAPGAVDGKMHGQGRQVPAARTGAGAGQARDGSEPNTNCVPTASTAGTFEGLPLTRGGTELFTYAPASIVVAGGQLVEMWPPVHLIDKNHVFEISPKLPAGLTLDRRIGLIHGKPEEATFGTQSYVVTLSSPDESTPWVKIAMLRLKVMDVFVPGHVATSFVENDAGETTITFREVIGRSQPEAICSPEVSLRQASPMQLIEDLCQQLEMQAQQRKPQPPVAPMLQSQGQAWQRPLPQQRPQGLPPHRDPQAPPRQLGQSGVPSRTAACNKDIDDMMATLVSMAFDSMPESQTQREQQLQQQSQNGYG